MADFELEAGKVFWNTEDDENGDNLETWRGEANFAILAEGDDFKGKLGISLHPGDLDKSVDDYETKRQKREKIRNDEYTEVGDYFDLEEAWAYQETEHLSFKVGRWDNTDKNGDYFGGYIDGYLAGFMSTQRSENQLQFGFSPTENMDFFLSLISTAPHQPAIPMCSRRKIAEHSTETTGSMYPRIATVCTGRVLIPLKYRQ